MYFFDPNKRECTRPESTDLHACGTIIPEDAYQDIYRFIEKDLPNQKRYNEARKKLYQYTFGEDRDFEDLRKEITEKMLLQGISRNNT